MVRYGTNLVLFSTRMVRFGTKVVRSRTTEKRVCIFAGQFLFMASDPLVNRLTKQIARSGDSFAHRLRRGRLFARRSPPYHSRRQKFRPAPFFPGGLFSLTTNA